MNNSRENIETCRRGYQCSTPKQKVRYETTKVGGVDKNWVYFKEEIKDCACDTCGVRRLGMERESIE